MKNPWKWLTLSLIAYPILLGISFALILFVSLQHYQTLIGAKDYRSIYDWDYPASATGDFNNDGKEDEITSGGCANFDSKGVFRKPLMCYPYYSSNSEKDGQKSTEYPYHSYMVKENGNWAILVLDKKFHLSRYEIQNDGTINKVSPNFVDVLRELLYSVPVFIFYGLLIPVAFLSSLFGWVVLIYLLLLIGTGYMWNRTNRLKVNPSKKNKA